MEERIVSNAFLKPLRVLVISGSLLGVVTSPESVGVGGYILGKDVPFYLLGQDDS